MGEITNCNCKLEPEDEELHLLIKSFYKGKTYAAGFKFSKEELNREYVEKQCRNLLMATIRGLIKDKIIKKGD